MGTIAFGGLAIVAAAALAFFTPGTSTATTGAWLAPATGSTSPWVEVHDGGSWPLPADP
jgi:hypothetical protein